ncbi:14249_t:CDS:2 [Funneliformis mosseae]|uniref:14249_t:CDS:1 n=1 Tax=Funneliformis mosseae TaxID=27381 RepID=A0A9N9H2K1_FUNMO|nr:14249_t:CDS:2 [Funneliformis mosseae]
MYGYGTFLELSNKADTLIQLVTHFNDYSEYSYEDGHLQEIISKFYNLKTLKIYPSCYGPFDYKYHNLEVLQIGYILIDTITCIIKSSGGRLRKILINEYDIYEDKFYENTLILIRTIYENCPLVEYLSLIFSPSNQHFSEFEILLQTCQRLKVLLLETESLCAKKRFMSGEKLSHALVRSAPKSLREIGIFYQFKFSPKTLEEFSEGWKGRPAITILAPDHDYKEEKYTKIIDKYKVDGVIKNFLCGFLIDFIFDY